MLICKPGRVTVIPIGPIAILLGLGGLTGAAVATQGPSLGVLLGAGVLAAGIVVPIVTGFATLRREGELLRWRGGLARGQAPAARCRFVATLTPQRGSKPTLDVTLKNGNTEVLELVSLPEGEAGEAKLQAMREALGLELK